MKYRISWICLLILLNSAFGIAQQDIITQYESAVNLQKERKHEQAIALFEELLSTVTEQAIGDSLMAEILHKKGISHYRLADRLEATKMWEQEIGLLQQLQEVDPLKIVKIHRNIGSSFQMMNRYPEAAEKIQLAIAVFEENQLTDSIRLAQMYMQLGSLESLMNDFEKAESHLQIGLPVIRRNFYDRPLDLKRAYEYMFQLHRQKQEPDEMIKYMNEALAVYEQYKNNEEYERASSHCFNNLGIAYYQKQEYQKALNFYEKAAAINSLLEGEEAILASNYVNISSALTELGRHEEALNYINQAKTIIEVAQLDQSLLAQAYSFEGDIHFNSAKYKQALASHQKALNQLTLDFYSDDIYANPSANDLILGSRPNYIEFLREKAKAFEGLATQENKLKNLQAAASTYDTLVRLIDLMRLDFDADESKSFLASNNKPIFESAIATNLALYETTAAASYKTRALELAEQSKGTLLLDALSKNNLNNLSNIPAELLEEERLLRTEITYLKQDIRYTIPAGEDAGGLRAELIQYQTQLASLNDSINATYPKLKQLRSRESLLSIERLQTEILADNQAFIQYYFGDSTLFTFYVDRNNYEINSQQIPTNLATSIEQLRDLLVKRENTPAEFSQLSYQLYDWLLADVLPKNENIKRLIIVPDDVLAYLPFDLLVTEATSTANFRTMNYLLKNYAISYSYSGSILVQQLARQNKGKPQLLAFAPSYETPLAPDAQVSILLRDGKYDLPGAKAEVETIGGLVSGKVFSGKKATEALFKSVANDYRYLHLSMHGLVEDEQPMRSRLLFYGDTTSTQDAMLHAYELYNTSLNADMVVLSACNTGMGKLQKGEGVMSLAHAFTYAGVPSTVMSLWQVSDASTAELLTDFYKNLKVDLPKDQALQQAKLEYLDNIRAMEQAHPFYWAAMLSYGDQKAVMFSSGLPIWGYGLIGLGVLLVIITIIGLISRSNSSKAA